jgi:hypothetical protein
MKKNLLNRFAFSLLLFLFAWPGQSRSQVANVSQTTVANVFPSDVNQPIVVITINISTPGYTLGTIYLSTAISTVSAISNAKVFYTGNVNSFSTANQFGSTVTSPNGAFSMNAGSPLPLLTGNNYFWVTYDITNEAVFCDTVDALCSSITGSTGSLTPVPSDPPGFAVVGDQDCVFTGFANGPATVHAILFPNPSDGKFSIQLPTGNGDRYITVFNLVGEKVFECTSAAGETDLSHLPQSVYFLQIRNQKNNYSEKIVIMQ